MSVQGRQGEEVGEEEPYPRESSGHGSEPKEKANYSKYMGVSCVEFTTELSASVIDVERMAYKSFKALPPHDTGGHAQKWTRIDSEDLAPVGRL